MDTIAFGYIVLFVLDSWRCFAENVVKMYVLRFVRAIFMTPYTESVVNCIHKTLKIYFSGFHYRKLKLCHL